MKIFIGSLPFSIKDSDLKDFFEEYGEVSSAKVISDKFTGRSRGFGFVEMPDENAAKNAIEQLNEAEVEGRTIVVNQAHDKPAGATRKGRNSSRGYANNRRGNNERRSDY